MIDVAQKEIVSLISVERFLIWSVYSDSLSAGITIQTLLESRKKVEKAIEAFIKFCFDLKRRGLHPLIKELAVFFIVLY